MPRHVSQIDVSIDRVALAARITRARERYERAQRLAQPRMNLSMEEMDALFSAIQLGRLLAVESRNRGPTWLTAFLRFLTKPRGEVGKLRDFTLDSGRKLLDAPVAMPARHVASAAMTTES